MNPLALTHRPSAHWLQTAEAGDLMAIARVRALPLSLLALAGQSGRRADGRHRPRHPGGRPVAQVRGVLAERVVVSTQLDPFVSLKALAAYSGLSLRKLRDLLVDPVRPLPHYRVGGKIVVRRSEFDAWMLAYRQVGNPQVERIVAEVIHGLHGPRELPP